MSELKATPGPWEADKFEGGANVEGPYCAVALDILTHEDAHLIAAAPDLYEALEELLFLTEHERPDWQHTEQERARAALAKARGEQP